MSRKRQATIKDFFSVSEEAKEEKRIKNDKPAAAAVAIVINDSSDTENHKPTTQTAKCAQQQHQEEEVEVQQEATVQQQQQEEQLEQADGEQEKQQKPEGEQQQEQQQAKHQQQEQQQSIPTGAMPPAYTASATAARAAAAATSAKAAATHLPPAAAAATAVSGPTGGAAGAATCITAVPSAAAAVSPRGELVPPEAAEKMWRDTLGDGWYNALHAELQQPYFRQCLSFVAKERIKQPNAIYPPEELVFNAFKATPLDKVRVVIVGQDPYHQPGQAMGLCFSVPRGVRPPPSLINIFKEIDSSIPGPSSLPLPHGDISNWASQGVLLLNAILTVRRDSPMAHKDAGWERFTDEVLSVINKTLTGVIFLLWGKAAQKKSSGVSPLRHKLLKAGHPSPLAVRFFLGCGHFAKCNELLQQMGKQPIDFRLKP